jgi:hypothetical protein
MSGLAAAAAPSVEHAKPTRKMCINDAVTAALVEIDRRSDAFVSTLECPRLEDPVTCLKDR